MPQSQCDKRASMRGRAPHIETAIDIILQHHAVNTDQQLICSFASVCKEWNLAVQSADTGALNIKYSASSADTLVAGSKEAQRQKDRFLSLADWLPKYGRLVHGLDITDDNDRHCDINHIERFDNMAGSLLQVGLQTAARQGLQLRSFKTNMLSRSNFLQALPTASLTYLDIQNCDGAALATTFPQLEVLQELRLLRGPDAAACILGLSCLSKLTALTLHGEMIPPDTRQLPMQLRQLDLYESSKWYLRKQHVFDLVHLTQLTRLRVAIHKYGSMKQGSAFPKQLVDLTMDIWERPGAPSATKAFQLTGLTQLERLKIHDPRETTVELLALAKMPRLEKLALEHSDWDDPLPFVTTSHVWPHIPQLQDFQVWCVTSKDQSTQWLKAMAHIAACTGLTTLHLEIALEKVEGQVPIDYCHCVSSLHKLQELQLHVSRGATYWSGHADLRPLTNLTMLKLHSRYGWDGNNCDGDDPAKDPIGASLLQLTQLQWLYAPVHSTAILSVVGNLRELRYLHVDELPFEAICWSGLSHLCGLKKLTRLTGFEGCREDELAQFWAAVRSS